MKKLILSVLVTGLMISTASQAGQHNTKYTSLHEKTLIGLCEAVMSNSKLRLNLALKRARVSYSDMQEGLVCNGKDPMTFAMLHHAEDNAHLIAKRSNVSLSHVIARN
jgi:hypothetical protein